MITVSFPDIEANLATLDVDTFFRVYEQNLEPAFEAIEGELRNITPDGATGDLGRAWGHTIKANFGALKHEGVIAAQGKPAQYVEFVEFGRAPGKMPPWQDGTSLHAWVTRKITSAHFQRTGKVMKKTPNRDAVVAQAAFLVARAIGARGTKPQMLLQKAFDKQKTFAERVIEHAAELALRAATK